MNNLQKYRQEFIENLIDTCMYGGGEVVLETLPLNRVKLVIKLGDPACIYRSDSIHLQCAVNPKGDCNTCQYKETK